MSEAVPVPGAAAAAPVPPPLPPPPPANPWKGLAVDVLLAVAALFIVSTLLVTPVIIIEAFGQPKGAGMDADALMKAALPEVTAAALVSMLVVGLLAWWLRGRNQAPAPARLRPAAAATLAIVAGVAIQGAALAVLNGLYTMAGEGPAQPSNMAPILALNQASPVLTWLMVVGMAPLAEELLFRRVMLHRFLVAGRGLSGLVVTSLLFAATHEVGQGGMHSLAQWLGLVLLYTGMGMGFGAVYLRTGRLWAAFLAHAACNATAMAAMAFSAG